MSKYIIAPAIALAMTLSLASVAFAENATSASATAKQKPTLDLACMRTAVEKRENAVQTAFTAYSTGITTALTARKSSLLAAWQIESKKERALALNNAWKAFREAKSGAKKTYNTARIDAWKQFKTDRSACGSGATGENPGHDEL